MKLRIVLSIALVSILASMGLFGCDGPPPPPSNQPKLSSQQQAEQMLNTPGMSEEQKAKIREGMKKDPPSGDSAPASTGK